MLIYSEISNKIRKFEVAEKKVDIFFSLQTLHFTTIIYIVDYQEYIFLENVVFRRKM